MIESVDKFKNVFDKHYEKPATYSQDGRRMSINFRKTY